MGTIDRWPSAQTSYSEARATLESLATIEPSAITAKSIAQQVRSALILARINTGATSLPPTLVTSLLAHGLLSPDRACDLAFRAVFANVRSVLLGAIADRLSNAQLVDAAATIRAERDNECQGHAIANIVPVLDERGFKEAAFETAGCCSHPSYGGHAMLFLGAQRLAAGDEVGALDCLFHVVGYSHLQDNLRVLAPRMSQRSLEAALVRLQHPPFSGHDHGRAQALLYVVPYLENNGSRRTALDLARNGFFPDDLWLRWFIDSLHGHPIAAQQEIMDFLAERCRSHNATNPYRQVTIPPLHPPVPASFENDVLQAAVKRLFGRGRPGAPTYGSDLVANIQRNWPTLEAIHADIARWTNWHGPGDPNDFAIAAALCSGDSRRQAIDEGIDALAGYGSKTGWPRRPVEHFLIHFPGRRPLPSLSTRAERILREQDLWSHEPAPNPLQPGLDDFLTQGAMRILSLAKAQLGPGPMGDRGCGLAIALLAPYLRGEDLGTATELALTLPSPPAWVHELISGECQTREGALDGLAPHLSRDSLGELLTRTLNSPATDWEISARSSVLRQACVLHREYLQYLTQMDPRVQRDFFRSLNPLDAQQSREIVKILPSLARDVIDEELPFLAFGLDIDGLDPESRQSLLALARGTASRYLRVRSLLGIAGHARSCDNLWPAILDELAAFSAQERDFPLLMAMRRSAFHVPAQHIDRFLESTQPFDVQSRTDICSWLFSNANCTAEQRQIVWVQLLGDLGRLHQGLECEGLVGAWDQRFILNRVLHTLDVTSDGERKAQLHAAVPEKALNDAKRKPSEPVPQPLWTDMFAASGSAPMRGTDAMLLARITAAFDGGGIPTQEHLFRVAHETRPDLVMRHFREQLTLGVHMHSKLDPFRALVEITAPHLDARQLEEAIAFGIFLKDSSYFTSEFNFFIPIACRHTQLHGFPTTIALFDRLSPDQQLPILEKLAPLMNNEDLEVAFERVMDFGDGGVHAPIIKAVSNLAPLLGRLGPAQRYFAWTRIVDRIATVRAEVASMLVEANGPLIKAMVGADGLAQVALAMS